MLFEISLQIRHHRGMRRSFCFAFVAFSAFFAFSAPVGAEPVRMTLKLAPGEVVTYQLKTVSDQRPSLGDSLAAASATTSFSSTIRLSVTGTTDGDFQVEGRFLQLEIGMRMGDQEIDPEGLPMIGDLKERLLQQALRLKLSPGGKVKDIHAPALTADVGGEGSAFFGEAGLYAKRSMESFLQHAYSWLPVEPVEPGATWFQDMPSGLVSDPPITFKMRHVFEKVEKVKGQPCAKIVTAIDIPETELFDGLMAFSGEGEAVTWFNLKKGRTQSSKSTLNVKFSGQNQPGVIQSVVTTSIDAVDKK